MDPEIVIVRDGNGYRLLHGLLWVTGALSNLDEVIVEVKDEGRLAVVRTRDGVHVSKDSHYLPLYLN